MNREAESGVVAHFYGPECDASLSVDGAVQGSGKAGGSASPLHAYFGSRIFVHGAARLKQHGSGDRISSDHYDLPWTNSQHVTSHGIELAVGYFT